MPRYFLAYATANESRDFYWDAINFRKLAEHDPGVPEIDVFMAISEAVPRRPAHERAVDELRKILEPCRNYRFRGAHFKSNVGRDFSSWHWCLTRIVEECAPEDYVFCINRSAYGPLQYGWYAEFVRQFEHDRRVALCGNSINFEGHGTLPGPEYTHVQSYAFLGRARELAACFVQLPGLQAITRRQAIIDGEITLSRRFLRSGHGITSLAWPNHVFFEDRSYDPALPQENISTKLTTTPFRHWRRDEYWALRHWPGRVRWFFARAHGFARSTLRDVLIRALTRQAGALRVSASQTQNPICLSPRAYLLSCVASDTVAVAIGSRARPEDRLFFFIHPGRNSRLIFLNPEITDHTVSFLGSVPDTTEPVELMLSPAPRLLAEILEYLREREGPLATVKSVVGRHDHLLPAAATSISSEWLEWAAAARVLARVGIEGATPYSMTLLQAGRERPGAAMAYSPGAGRRIGVHVHLHYQNLWDEIRRSLAHLPADIGLHVTTTTENAGLFEKIRHDFPTASVTLVENRGRDIGPFVQLLNEGAFDSYQYVCKIHGKKSPLRGAETYYGRAWRRRCLADLLGTPAHIARIIAMFDEDARLGIVGPAYLRQPNDRISPAAALGPNRALVQEFLSRRFGDDVAASARVDFFAGSMFWFRPRALDRVRALNLSAADFPDEAQQPDATMAHALERLISMIAVISGFRMEGVVLPDRYSAHDIAGSGLATKAARFARSTA